MGKVYFPTHQKLFIFVLELFNIQKIQKNYFDKELSLSYFPKKKFEFPFNFLNFLKICIPMKN